MAKVTFGEVSSVLRETSNSCYDLFGNYSYITGTYESILARLVADLPKHKQAEVMRSLRSAQERMQKDA